MDFSDTSNLTGIIEDITFHTGVDTNAYTLKDRTRNVNQWYQRAIVDILSSVNYYEWRDTNVAAGTDNSWTTSADGTAVLDMSASTRGYALPTTNDVWMLRKVAFSYDGGATYYEAKPFNIAMVQYQPDDSDIDDNVSKTEPMYRWVGNQLEGYPLPATNSTNGIKIWFVAKPDIFVSTDTTQEPAIMEAFRRILSLGASYDWLMSREPEKAQVIRAELEQVRQEMRAYYANLIDENYDVQSLRVRYE